MEYYINTNGELTHWGIKGMRWGVRRYQNKDGSLTPAGKKRRAKLEGELEKLGGVKKTESEDAPKKKSVSEMSNKELQEHTTRMQLEKNYHDAQKQLAASMPQKQVSKGQKMAEKFLNEAIMPAATNAGKAYLEKLLKEKAGINTEDPVAALEKTWKKLDYEQKIDKIKNPDKYMTWDDKTKQYDLDRKKKRDDAEDQAAADKAKKEADERAAKEKSHRVNAQKEEQARAGAGSAVNTFVNKVTESHSRPAVKNVIGDAVVLKDQVYIDNGKSYVDNLLGNDMRDDD